MQITRRWRRCQLGIARVAGNESASRVNMPLGAYIVRIVGITRVDIMDLSKYDETPLGSKLRRRTVRIGGEYVKTRTYLDEGGAERDTSENKITRSVYRKTMKTYWSSLDWRVRERAERMSIYVNYPVPSRALAISLKKQGATAPGVLDTGATKHERNGSAR